MLDTIKYIPMPPIISPYIHIRTRHFQKSRGRSFGPGSDNKAYAGAGTASAPEMTTKYDNTPIASAASHEIIKYPHMRRICPDMIDATTYIIDNPRMKVFPRAILRMKNIQYLTIRAMISRLPARINKLPLKIVNFSGNNLLYTPKQFSDLRLHMVNLSGNPLTKLYICADTIQMLDIRNTKLKVFPNISKAALVLWAGSTDILYWPRNTAEFSRNFKIYLHERTYVPRGIRTRIRYNGV